MRQAEDKLPVGKHTREKGGKRAKGSGSNMVFSSFYPTKEEKMKIKVLLDMPGDVIGTFSVLVERQLVVTVREDTDRACFICMVRENVPYGDPCKCLTFWHSDIATLLAMVTWYVRNKLDQWLEDDRAVSGLEEFNW